MLSQTHQPGEIPSVEKISARIRACSMQAGWDEVELAEKAGLSRTTLYHLHRGDIQRPRITTLTRLADAFDLPLEEFLWGSVPLREFASQAADTDEAQAFDRQTNSIVKEVLAAEPHLFNGWTANDWEELYSTFGVGGELNETGIRAEAGQINESRQTRHRLQVVLETHLRDVAVQMVDSLYRMVSPEGNLEPGADLDELLKGRDGEGGEV